MLHQEKKKKQKKQEKLLSVPISVYYGHWIAEN